MTVKNTIEQNSCINTREKNVLVSASAGSGKTFVLVSRIIKLITEEKIDIDRLVVVTFTEASAKEMKERISKKIDDLIEKHPKDEHLKKQKNLIYRANISTIHSFCKKIIKENFSLCGVDPKFRIMDDKESYLIKKEVLSNLFNELYEKYSGDVSKGDIKLKNIQGENFVNLIEKYGDKIFDNKLQDIILMVYEKSAMSPFPNQWIDENIKKYENITDENINKSFWIKKIIEDTRSNIEYSKKINEKYLKISVDKLGPKAYKEQAQEELNNISSLHNYLKNHEEIDYFKVKKMVEDIEFRRLKPIKKSELSLEENIDLAERYKYLRTLNKKYIKELKEEYFFNSKKSILKDFKQFKGDFKVIGEIVKVFSQDYQEEKGKINTLDYNDLEQFTIKLLLEIDSTFKKPIYTNTAKELKNRYYEILIDEYQDCNETQELIFKAISKNEESIKNRFMVGDVKQSIYSFRGANPKLFIEKFDKYEEKASGLNKKIILGKNFRSREVVLENINFIFKQIMNKELGGINYKKEGLLEVGKNFKLRDKDIKISNAVDIIIGDMENRPIQKQEFEGEIIANKIKSLLDEKNPIYIEGEDGEYKKAQYKDITILVKSRTHIDKLTKVFKSKEIPFFTSNTGSFFNTLEIQILLNYLEIIDNPIQDIPLISVLKSPLYNLTGDDLVEIRQVNNKKDFYYCLNNFNKEGELKNKVDYFIDDLILFSKMKKIKTISELIIAILEKTNYISYIEMFPNAKQRVANVKQLIVNASEYEKTNYTSLFNFIQYVGRLKKNNISMSEGKVGTEKENKVRIMTIHQSKGLEFPIVILAFLNGQFNMVDERKNFIIHNEIGVASKNINLEYRVENSTLPRNIIKSAIKKERIEEEIRVLYVALTRAKEKLILTGVTKNFSKDLEKYQIFADTEDLTLDSKYLEKCKSFYELVITAVIRNEKYSNKFSLENINKQNNYEIYNQKIGIDLEIIKKYEGYKEKVEGDYNFIESKIKEISNKKSNDNIRNEIREKIIFTYKHNKRSEIPIRISISDIKRLKQLENIKNQTEVNLLEKKEIEYPSFDQKISKTKQGIIIHKIIENIEFDIRTTKEDVDKIIKELVKNKMLTDKEVENIDKNIFYNFIKSGMFKRISLSNEVVKEKHFILELDGNEFFEEATEKDKIYLSGIIDCYFEEEGEIVIVDYKSNYITKDNIDIISKSYSMQLKMYKKAIERLTKKKVKKSIIYYLRGNIEVEI